MNMTMVCLLFAIGCFGQETTIATVQALGYLKGQTIISNEFPRAELTIGKDFRFAGTQRVNPYGNAEAEQYLFVRVGRRRVVDRFYWVQFEHLLPSNTGTYDYTRERAMEMGDFEFIYDVKSWPDCATMAAEDPASEGAAIERLLKKHHLSFPHRAVRVRMFHLPSPDRRTELMIIYGEALPQYSDVPVRQGGVELDIESPGSAQMFLNHACRDLVMRRK